MRGISKILAIAIIAVIIIILAIIAIYPVGQFYNLAKEAPQPPCKSHMECVGDLCRKVSGCGSNECATHADCNQTNVTHTECIGDICTTMQGAGTDECETNEDCMNQTNETHTECVGEICTVMLGAGTDECETNEDCMNQTDNPPEFVWIYNWPLNNQTNITQSTNVTIYTRATDDVWIDSMKVYVDGEMKKQCSILAETGDCDYTSTYPFGNHTYYGWANDSIGQITTSETKSFYVE